MQNVKQAPQRAWHTVPVDALDALLETDGQAGLTSAEAAKRLLARGPNELRSAPGRSV